MCIRDREGADGAVGAALACATRVSNISAALSKTKQVCECSLTFPLPFLSALSSFSRLSSTASGSLNWSSRRWRIRKPWMSFFQRRRTRSCCLASSRSSVDCSRLRIACARGAVDQLAKHLDERGRALHLAQGLGVLFCDDHARHERRCPPLAKFEADLRASHFR